MQVRVTGASGFIGRHLVDALRARGHECDTPGLDQPRLDLTDTLAIERWFAAGDADVLVHCAWYAGADRIISAENAAWVTHTQRLLEAFVAAGGQRVVTIGTCFEYALGDNPLVEGVTPIRPHTVYGRAKADVADVVARLTDETALTGAHARVGYVYGPGEGPTRLVPALIESLTAGRRFPATSGLQRRDYLYAADVGSALALLVEADVTGPVNVASGTAIAVADLITAIAKELGAVELLDLGALPRRAGDPELVELSIQRLTDLGWKPEVDLAEGARRTVRSLAPSSSKKATPS